MLEMEGQNPNLTICPTFSRYSSERFGEIADEIIRKEEKSSAEPHDEAESSSNSNNEDFEFALVSRDPVTFPISADDIFSNGQIRPIFPVFNQDLSISDRTSGDENPPEKKNQKSIRIDLRKLLIEDRDNPSSSSSSNSESKELAGIPSGSYCVWTPRSVPTSPDRCKKSNSTGSSKRWKFRDLLHRSSSEGKETFVFLKDDRSEIMKGKKNSGEVKVAGKGTARGEKMSAHEMHYVRNRAIKEADRRRSFLPYKKDIVGFFANVNGLGKSFHPF
ncbi:uncharacterized protein LOC143846265 [Tasmannia lanceolata]|uniref:uncharacterized protein LOC143846265 n=1 Tax=Tasmannia lanceolata TaxID=3420 RepID=UPI004063F8D1